MPCDNEVSRSEIKAHICSESLRKGIKRTPDKSVIVLQDLLQLIRHLYLSYGIWKDQFLKIFEPLKKSRLDLSKAVIKAGLARIFNNQRQITGLFPALFPVPLKSPVNVAIKSFAADSAVTSDFELNSIFVVEY